VLSPDDIKKLILSSDYLNLKLLNLSNRELNTLPEEIALLENLEELDISYNEFEVFPPVIFKLKKLKVLYFHRNRLKIIPDEIKTIDLVEFIDLSFNKIHTVSEKIGNLVNLEVLDLAGNKITHLPLSLIHLTRIKRLFLEENNFIFPPQQIVDRGLYSLMFYLAQYQSKTTSSNIHVEKKDLTKSVKVLLENYFQQFVEIVEKELNTKIEYKLQADIKPLEENELSLGFRKKLKKFIHTIPILYNSFNIDNEMTLFTRKETEAQLKQNMELIDKLNLKQKELLKKLDIL
jgi:Leucine-rich repeat (LRR) protein